MNKLRLHIHIAMAYDLIQILTSAISSSEGTVLSETKNYSQVFP